MIQKREGKLAKDELQYSPTKHSLVRYHVLAGSATTSGSNPSDPGTSSAGSYRAAPATGTPNEPICGAAAHMADVVITQSKQIDEAIAAALEYVPLRSPIAKRRIAVKPNETWASVDEGGV
jgi:hypothetical protein